MYVKILSSRLNEEAVIEKIYTQIIYIQITRTNIYKNNKFATIDKWVCVQSFTIRQRTHTNKFKCFWKCCFNNFASNLYTGVTHLLRVCKFLMPNGKVGNSNSHAEKSLPQYFPLTRQSTADMNVFECPFSCSNLILFTLKHCSSFAYQRRFFLHLLRVFE